MLTLSIMKMNILDPRLSWIMLLVLLLTGSMFFIYTYSRENKPEILVIIPAKHRSMDYIYTSFKQQIMSSSLGSKYKISVKNLRGNVNRLQNIIATVNSKNNKYSMLVPIGTEIAKILNENIDNIPIVALGISDNLEIENRKYTGVIDETTSLLQLGLDVIINYKPDLNSIVIIHSADTESLEKIRDIDIISTQRKIPVKYIMVKTNKSLYTAAQSFSDPNDLIMILKDHTVVRGIKALLRYTDKYNIPIVSSDEGSVRDGAVFAIGVDESEIGAKGAELAIEVLEKSTKVSEIPMVYMRNTYIFINSTEARKRDIDIADLSIIAKRYGLTKVFVE